MSFSKYSPSHYNRGVIEVWDFIADQQLDYFSGNVVKYICRAGHKAHEEELDDLRKAKAYIDKRIELTHKNRNRSWRQISSVKHSSSELQTTNQ